MFEIQILWMPANSTCSSSATGHAFFLLAAVRALSAMAWICMSSSSSFETLSCIVARSALQTECCLRRRFSTWLSRGGAKNYFLVSSSICLCIWRDAHKLETGHSSAVRNPCQEASPHAGTKRSLMCNDKHTPNNCFLTLPVLADRCTAEKSKFPMSPGTKNLPGSYV
jgi:hypothetical protein